MSHFEDILYEERENFSIITINRAESYNSLRAQSKKELTEAIKISNKNSKIKSVILTGSGKAFCSGQDLNDRTIQSSNKNSRVDLGLTLEKEWNPLMLAVRKSPKILIGAINGVAAGAGLSLSLNLDLLISKTDTKFISGFTKLGLVPDAGLTHTLTKALGKFTALDFFISNSPLLGKDLFDKGLLKSLSENPLEESIRLAQEISQLSSSSLKFLKFNIQKAVDKDYEDLMERERMSQRFLGYGEDYQEGLNAFFEKRPPLFS